MLSFESVKALAHAALITQVEPGVLASGRRTYSGKLSPEKVSRDHVYNQNGYDTTIT